MGHAQQSAPQTPEIAAKTTAHIPSEQPKSFSSRVPAESDDCQGMAALFKRAARDADAICGLEACPDFFARYVAREKLVIESEQIGDRRPALVEQLNPEA